MRLVKSDDSVRLTRRNAQIQVLIANVSILKVDNEPLAEPVEHYFVEIFRFDFPVSVHAGCELFPLNLGDKDCTRVVVRVVRPSLLRI